MQNLADNMQCLSCDVAIDHEWETDMKIRYSLLALVVVNLAAPEAAVAIPVDLTSGTTGTTHFGQSFNETRGVTATVLGGTNLELLSMTLADVNIGNPGGAVGARVYGDGSGLLLASADMAVSTGIGQDVTIPILASLVSGGAYRFAFFVTDAGGGSGTMFDPNPNTSSTFSPYTDSSGLFQISAAWDGSGDVFPATVNAFMPFTSLEVRPGPEPGSIWLLACALLCAGAFAFRRRA